MGQYYVSDSTIYGGNITARSLSSNRIVTSSGGVITTEQEYIQYLESEVRGLKGYADYLNGKVLGQQARLDELEEVVKLLAKKELGLDQEA